MADFDVALTIGGAILKADPRNQVLGGNASLTEDSPAAQGVYAQFPATQLKYSTGTYDTQARLYVALGPTEQAKFLEGFSEPVKTYVKAVTGPKGYMDFILTQVQESQEEKYQVTELLSDDYVAYFYGEKARVYSYSGKLFSTYQDDWWEAFSYLYDNLLRGSRMAGLQRVATLRYDSRVVNGVLLNFQSSMSSEMQMAVDFSFQFLVTSTSRQEPLLTPGKTLGTNAAPSMPGTAVGVDLSTFVQKTSPQAQPGIGKVTTTIRDAAKLITATPASPDESAAAASTAPIDDAEKKALADDAAAQKQIADFLSHGLQLPTKL